MKNVNILLTSLNILKFICNTGKSTSFYNASILLLVIVTNSI